MSDLKGIEYKRFEDIKHIREDGSEYWSARELGSALDYAKWENFAKVIKRAMIACENSGHSIPDDFPEVRKIVAAGAATKPKKDYELSRYACYLIVQNGDPRKEVIALGQTYFAIQTYRQEVADHFNELDEDNRRLVVRGDIKQWNQMLAETAHNAGVITNEEFAIFQNAGYMGLYGGLDVDDIHTKKQLEVGQKILDYMGSTELIANLFRISQTEEKLRKDKIVGAETMSSAFFSLFIGMHLMMTMTYDGITSWKQYELTLPMSKYQIIFSKYLASLILVPVSVMGTSIIYIIHYMVYHNFLLSQFGCSIAIAIVLPVLWCSICLAIAQWFGYMSVQYVRMICTLFAIFFVSKISKNMEYVTQNLVQNPTWVAILVLSIIVISYFISVTGYSRKK